MNLSENILMIVLDGRSIASQYLYQKSQKNKNKKVTTNWSSSILGNSFLI